MRIFHISISPALSFYEEAIVDHNIGLLRLYYRPLLFSLAEKLSKDLAGGPGIKKLRLNRFKLTHCFILKFCKPQFKFLCMLFCSLLNLLKLCFEQRTAMLAYLLQASTG